MSWSTTKAPIDLLIQNAGYFTESVLSNKRNDNDGDRIVFPLFEIFQG